MTAAAAATHEKRFQAAKDIAAGTISGWASILVVHPLDTVRTRLQTAEPGRFKGVMDLCVKTARNEGWIAFYKGLTPPLVAQGLQKATMFFAYGAAQRAMMQQHVSSGVQLQLSIPQLFACGAFAGGVHSFVACPVELVRNRLQVQYDKLKSRSLYTGPIDCLLKTYRADGLRGLYRGLFPMIIRDVPGVGAWYATFELARRLLTPSASNSGEVGKLRVMAAGALAGIGYWTTAFPQDAVKSVIQTQRYAAGQLAEGFFQCAARMVREEGFLRLYRGYSVAVMRGIPGASITFLAYTTARKALEPL